MTENPADSSSMKVALLTAAKLNPFASNPAVKATRQPVATTGHAAQMVSSVNGPINSLSFSSPKAFNLSFLGSGVSTPAFGSKVGTSGRGGEKSFDGIAAPLQGGGKDGAGKSVLSKGSKSALSADNSSSSTESPQGKGESIPGGAAQPSSPSGGKKGSASPSSANPGGSKSASVQVASSRAATGASDSKPASGSKAAAGSGSEQNSGSSNPSAADSSPEAQTDPSSEAAQQSAPADGGETGSPSEQTPSSTGKGDGSQSPSTQSASGAAVPEGKSSGPASGSKGNAGGAGVQKGGGAGPASGSGAGQSPASSNPSATDSSPEAQKDSSSEAAQQSAPAGGGETPSPEEAGSNPSSEADQQEPPSEKQMEHASSSAESPAETKRVFKKSMILPDCHSDPASAGEESLRPLQRDALASPKPSAKRGSLVLSMTPFVNAAYALQQREKNPGASPLFNQKRRECSATLQIIGSRRPSSILFEKVSYEWIPPAKSPYQFEDLTNPDGPTLISQTGEEVTLNFTLRILDSDKCEEIGRGPVQLHYGRD